MTLAASSSPASIAAPARRMIQLDVLRAVAILLVLGRHPVVGVPASGLLHWPATLWFNFGWTGVDLFFVLSGFLVGGLLLGELHKRGQLDAKRFIIRRGFKIWPAYYALVLGSVAIKTHQGGLRWALHLYWPNLLHVQNYVNTELLSHTWSLAVEEHFYLALPLLLMVLTSFGRHRNAVRAVPLVAVMVMVLCTAARFILNWNRPYSDATHYYPTHLRMDGLAMGVLLAYLHHFHPAVLPRLARRRGLLLLAGIAAISPMMFVDLENRFVWTIGFNLLYLGYACILVAFVYTPVGDEGGVLGRFFSGILARALAWVGLFSYSIYLWHLSLGRHPVQWLRDHTSLRMGSGADWLILMTIYVVVALGAGVVMGKLIEMPALAVRDWFFPSRAGALEGAGLPNQETSRSTRTG
jgi:peptidoglycan/LPS O-acetylase OafA/YrhL